MVNRVGDPISLSHSLIKILRYGQVPLYGPFTVHNKRVSRSSHAKTLGMMMLWEQKCVRHNLQIVTLSKRLRETSERRMNHKLFWAFLPFVYSTLFDLQMKRWINLPVHEILQSQYVVHATCFRYCMHLGMNRSCHLSSLPPVQTFSYLHLGFKLQAFSYDIPSFPDYSFSVLEYLPLALTDI